MQNKYYEAVEMLKAICHIRENCPEDNYVNITIPTARFDKIKNQLQEGMEKAGVYDKIGLTDVDTIANVEFKMEELAEAKYIDKYNKAVESLKENYEREVASAKDEVRMVHKANAELIAEIENLKMEISVLNRRYESKCRGEEEIKTNAINKITELKQIIKDYENNIRNQDLTIDAMVEGVKALTELYDIDLKNGICITYKTSSPMALNDYAIEKITYIKSMLEIVEDEK